MRRKLLSLLAVIALSLPGCSDCSDEASQSKEESIEEQAQVGDLDTVADWLQARAQPFESIDGLQPLIARASERPLILLGEASHGTKEFYDWRAELSLGIAEAEGLDFVGIEGDWHAVRAADRYVMGEGDAEEVNAVLVEAFDRWPQWMWANEEFAQFLRRVRAFNEANEERPIRIYGIDMQSFFESLERLASHVDASDHERASELADRLDCMSRHAPEPQRYAQALRSNPNQNCEEDIQQAMALTGEIFSGDSPEAVSARKHALNIASGESQIRRSVFQGGQENWNVRASHMFDITEALLQVHGPDARGAIWAHNTHIGDARATDMRERQRVNIGQLAREKMGDDAVFAIGFSTHHGEVIAGRQWNAPRQTMEVPTPPSGSVDEILSRLEANQYFIAFEDDDGERPFWRERPGQRAMGVVYQPEHEQRGNYVATNPAERYDALIFIERTTSLTPL